MQFEEFMLKLLTLCAAWTLSLAQHNTETNPWNQKVDTQPQVQPSSDDDFDPLDFEEAQNYLEKYFYFHGPKPRNLQSPVDIRSAIEGYQRFNELDITGRLDPETMAKMKQPRCGNADLVGKRQNSPLIRRRRRYALAGQKWQKKALTYKIVNYTPDLPRATTKGAIQAALRTWSDVTPLTFTETKGTADIDVKFAENAHGDGYPFDGIGGTLAHAYFPGRGIGGDAHFDDNEFFSDRSYRGTNLFLVAAHELGHSLGLSHSSNSRALMAPYYQGYMPNFKLPLDDIKGIQRLYGKGAPPPSGPGPQPPSSPGNPRPPSSPDSACLVTFQATMNLNGRIYLFSGSQYWRLEENLTPTTKGYPREITSYWRPGSRDPVDVLSNIDAAIVMQKTGNVVFFKGNKWYEYKRQGQVRSGTLESLGLPADIPRIDAAVIWEGNNKPYFFVGSEYYRFNEDTGKIDAGYPKAITPNWVNIPGNVDAAFGARGYTYFVIGQDYFTFNNNAVKRQGGSRNFGNTFFQCNALRRFSRSAGNKEVIQLPTVLVLSFLALLHIIRLQ